VEFTSPLEREVCRRRERVSQDKVVRFIEDY
jgi:hypothetical protein